MSSKFKKEITRIKDFGVSLTFWRVMSHCFKCAYSKKHKKVLKFLEDNFGDAIKEINDEVVTEGKIDKNLPVWIFWWQGLEDAPAVVKRAVNSIFLHCGKHKVIVLDKDNLKDYIKFPQYIWDKFEQGKISITHLSDLIRVSCLADYGGIWCDATLFAIQDFPDNLYGLSWYSVKLPYQDKHYVSENKWSVYFMACCLNNRIVKATQKLLFLYWERYDLIIDYFLTDYIIMLLNQYDKEIRTLIDSVPINNQYIFWLAENLYKNFSENEINQIKNSTFLFKCNWRIQLRGGEGKAGKESNFYHYFIGGETADL